MGSAPDPGAKSKSKNGNAQINGPILDEAAKTMSDPVNKRERTRVPQLKGFGGRILSVLLVMFAFSYQGYAAETGARRYVDFSLSQEQKTFSVVSKPVVQMDLHLTAGQLTNIAVFQHKPLKEIPSITNLLAQTKAANNSDRREIVVEEMKQYNQYLLTSLSNVLTASQSKRLQEIIWQVDGLKSLNNNHELATALSLSDEQLEQVRDVFAFYEPILNPLYRRLGRQMIAGLSGDETLQERTKQVESLSDAVTIIEKERDRDLYRILTTAQKEKWRDLVGKPVHIQWPLELWNE
jgi:hypothetical protein